MTVAELIVKLQAMPQCIPVIFNYRSEYTELENEDVRLVLAESREMIKHNGVYMNWYERYKKPNDPSPEFVTVCRLP